MTPTFSDKSDLHHSVGERFQVRTDSVHGPVWNCVRVADPPPALGRVANGGGPGRSLLGTGAGSRESQVPHIRRPHGQVLVRGVEIPILRPGKPQNPTRPLSAPPQKPRAPSFSRSLRKGWETPKPHKFVILSGGRRGERSRRTCGCFSGKSMEPKIPRQPQKLN